MQTCMTGRGATRAEIFPAQPGLKSARKCADGIRMNIAHAAALTCALAAAPAPAGEAVHVVGSRQLRIAVVDPFGNVLGIMHNPHFAEMH